jgi:hypothetical protein
MVSPPFLPSLFGGSFVQACLQLPFKAQEPEFCFFTSIRAFKPETQNLEVPFWRGGPDESLRMMAASPIVWAERDLNPNGWPAREWHLPSWW